MKKGTVKESGTMSNDVCSLSHKIEDLDDKAVVNITFDVKFPFKYLANNLVLQLMDIYFAYTEAANNFKDSPHHEIAKMLLEVKKKQEGKK